MYTAKSSNTLTVIRGARGTTAASHSDDVIVKEANAFTDGEMRYLRLLPVRRDFGHRTTGARISSLMFVIIIFITGMQHLA